MIAREIRLKKRLIIALNRVVVKLALDLQIDLHDRNYVLRRLQQEGVKFLTVTLPTFAKFAIHCIETGSIDRSYAGITAFRWTRSSPVFMAGLLFKSLSGCPDSLFKIRQFCEYFYKTAFSFTESELKRAQEKYLRTEEELSSADVDYGAAEGCRKIFHQLFPKIARATLVDVLKEGTARDGPGAFAGSEMISRVHNCSYEQYKRLPTDTIGLARSDFASISGYFRSYPSSDEAALLVHENKVCDLRFVPKDSRGPRTISKEPYFLLKAQMSFMDWITRLIETESDFRVNFSDQTVNQGLSRAASVDRLLSTLDLREASDRLKRRLSKLIFQYAPAVRWFLVNATSTHVRMPDGSVRPLSKLANMGSGVCFPILALTTYIAAVYGITRKKGRTLKDASKMVYVYGDDVICPTDCVSAVIWGLESIGLLVNRDKSFSSGHFRESCGADYFHGKAVAPVRLKLSGEGLESVDHYRNGYVPVSSDSGVLQLERHCRELVDHGLFKTADYYYSLIERRLGPLPSVALESPYIGRYSGHMTHNKVWSGFVPTTVKRETPAACGRKALGSAFRSKHGLGDDYERVPLRRQIVLKHVRVLDPATVYMYGSQKDPRDLFPIGGGIPTPQPVWSSLLIELSSLIAQSVCR